MTPIPYRVVVIGGGTGTHMVLRGLSPYVPRISLTAVVAMTDSGGSTGRLRDSFGILPIGDVRNALTAMAAMDTDDGVLLRRLFTYRFDRGDGLAGHSIGNLLLTALRELLGSEREAIAAAARLLRIAGRVLPVTFDNVHLVATYDDGVRVRGEALIDVPPPERYARHIKALTLDGVATITPEVSEAIMTADLIIFAPGDLYTSLLPNFLIPGMVDVMAQATAKRVYIANLMSRPGQTTGFRLSDHLREITRYSGVVPHVVMVHNQPLSAAACTHYANEHEYPVEIDAPAGATTVLAADLLLRDDRHHLVRHDPQKVASVLSDYWT
jgi:uncharacterized cofD-like protein